MKMLLICNVVVLVSLFTGPVHAGLLGPSNYDECITDSMKGVSSEVAARAIMQSCRERFSGRVKNKPASRPLSDEELRKLTGRAELEEANHSKAINFKAKIYNGNQNLTISEITLSITTTQKGEKAIRQYAADMQYSSDIPPLKTGSISAEIITGDKNTEYSWDIIGARGY
ncbi:MAG TPA: hypothetical protein VJT11_04120 [Nitrospiraceae bacterium]|nr:hypothetical protein [Nitrospiraceae bacterium]